MGRLSVVIAARDEPTLAETVTTLCEELPPDCEIVVVDDDSHDDSAAAVEHIDPRVHVHRARARLGAAVARNVGARFVSGEIIVFADAHVQPASGWTALIDALDDPRIGAVGPTLVDDATLGVGRGLRLTDVELNVEWLPPNGSAPCVVPLLPGFFFAMRRQTFADVGGFDGGMTGWGIEDIELCMHLVLLGYCCVVVPEIEVIHAPVAGTVPEHHLEWEHGLHNILRTGHVHFGSGRLAQMHEAYGDDETFTDALDAVVAGDAESRRLAVQSTRRFDDDWFFEFCGSA